MPKKMDVDGKVRRYLAEPRRWTLWTWIKIRERSKDPSHCRSIKRQMEAMLREQNREGKVATCRSVKGGRSWRVLGEGIPF